MSERIRTVVYVLSAAVVFGVMMYGAAGLPAFGSFSGAYTDMILQIATLERHVYNIPSAVNFDYRAFDTLGEEFIFFTSICGVLLIFSAVHARSEQYAEPIADDREHRASGAIRWFPTGLTAFIAAMGMNLAAHGQLTPGGGFQGGAVFGSALVCIYLGVGLHAFVRVARKETFDALESLGAFSFGAIGVATMLVTGAFLKNALALGQTGATVSGGTIYLINCAVFVEIACGFVVLMLTFLKQTQQIEEPE